MQETILEICTFLLVAGLLRALFPNRSGHTIAGLVTLFVLLTGIFSMGRMDWSISQIDWSAEQIDSYDRTQQLTEDGIALLKARLQSLLTDAGITLPEDSVEISYRLSENKPVEIRSVRVRVRFYEDQARALAILRALLTDAIPIEVYYDG